MKFTELREDLQELVLQAEEYAIQKLQRDDTFYPYIYLEEQKIEKIILDDLDLAIEEAQDIISELDVDTVILVYQDIISFNDGDIDAIITHVFDFDEDYGYSYALGFKRENDQLLFLKEHVFTGNIRNCLVF